MEPHCGCEYRSNGDWEMHRLLSSKRGILISSIAQAHRCYRPCKVNLCATEGHFES